MIERMALIICSFEGQCSTSDWDFSMGYRNMAISKKQGIRFNVEVKEDQKCHHTGNVGLEFMCSGKPFAQQFEMGKTAQRITIFLVCPFLRISLYVS